MNCVLFAKMDQVFSLKKQNIKKYWKNGKKDTGKVRELCVGLRTIFGMIFTLND